MTSQMVILSVPLKSQRENYSAAMDHLLALYHLDQPLRNHQRKLQREHIRRKLQMEQLQELPQEKQKLMSIFMRTIIEL